MGSRTGGRQAGRRGELGALVADPEPGLTAHLHVGGREDALAPRARDAPLVPVLVHLADEADALPLQGERSQRLEGLSRMSSRTPRPPGGLGLREGQQVMQRSHR